MDKNEELSQNELDSFNEYLVLKENNRPENYDNYNIDHHNSDEQVSDYWKSPEG